MHSRASPGGSEPSDPTTITKHSLVVAGHHTSISLEDAFWRRLKIVAALRGSSVAALVAAIDGGRGAANLSSAIRVFLLDAAVDGEPGDSDADAGAQ